MDKIRYFANKPSAVLVPEESTFTEKEITENGTYEASQDGVDGYSVVTVDVFSPALETLTATENKTYTAPEGKAYDEVVVNVPSQAPTLVTKTITANGVYTASQDNADGFSSVNVSVSIAGAQTLTAPSLTQGTTSRAVQAYTSDYNGKFVQGIVYRIGDESYQDSFSITFGSYILPWIYSITPLAGGNCVLYAKCVGAGLNDSAETNITITIPSATETTGYCSVAGLGNSNPASLTYTYDANFPRSFQEVQDTYGNVFIKIPTIYRKILASSDGQITSYALATSALDSDYKPFPCFIDWSNNNAILPYILIGKYQMSSATTANSVNASSIGIILGDARTLAQARGTGYQLFDWQMWELFRDLGVILSRYVNINQNVLIKTIMGLTKIDSDESIDGVIKGSTDDNQQWYCAYNPADYYSPGGWDSETNILSNNYAKLSYKCPPATGWITKLGYDPDNPFFNQPEEASGTQSTYYCDKLAVASGNNVPIQWRIGAVSNECGWFCTSVYYSFGATMRARLCYRPILGATGYTE